MLTALDTIWVPNPDYNLSDELAETERLIQRQGAIGDLISGKISLPDVLDLLSYQGISPDTYLAEVSDNLLSLGF